MTAPPMTAPTITAPPAFYGRWRPTSKPGQCARTLGDIALAVMPASVEQAR